MSYEGILRKTLVLRYTEQYISDLYLRSRYLHVTNDRETEQAGREIVQERKLTEANAESYQNHFEAFVGLRYERVGGFRATSVDRRNDRANQQHVSDALRCCKKPQRGHYVLHVYL